MAQMRRVYFLMNAEYYMASTQQEEEGTKKRFKKLPENEHLFVPVADLEILAQKGQVVIDNSMSFATSGHQNGMSARSSMVSAGASMGSAGASSAIVNVHQSRIQMTVAPHADTDGVVRIGWNTLISYMDSTASLIKTADTVIGGDFTTNTLLQLCELAKYGRLVIKEIEFNGSVEGVFAATAPKYKCLNAAGELVKEKKLAFPAASSKDEDNTIRVMDQQYLQKMGVSLEFGGFEYLEITTPKALTSTITFTIEYYPRG